MTKYARPTDRKVGTYWEQKFCEMAESYGVMVMPLQIGKSDSATAKKNQRHIVLPDVMIMSGQYHEIKHKSPTRDGHFGLEVYRFDSLIALAKETGQDVMYTIHNHALSGGRGNQVNHTDHWVTINALDLQNRHVSQRLSPTYCGGHSEKILRSTYYWPIGLWMPLAQYWQIGTTNNPDPSEGF